jgi:hypothetical protein
LRRLVKLITKEFAYNVARVILEEMPWDYDPIRDVEEIAHIIIKEFVKLEMKAEQDKLKVLEKIVLETVYK